MTKQKKRIVALAASVVVLCILALAIPLLLPLFEKAPSRRPINFADASLSLYPELDSEYMSLNRTIYFVKSGTTTIKTEMTEETYPQYSKAVRHIVKLIEAALAGDSAAYNACFSAEFIAASGAYAPFTKQKLYDIAIIEYSTNAAVPEGYEKASLYGLAYKIKDNNGSLRTDIESDAELEQYLSVVEDCDGNVYIHGIQVIFKQ